MATVKNDFNLVWHGATPVDPPQDLNLRWQQGWVIESPTYDDFNYIQRKIGSQIKYIGEHGVVPWGEDISYDRFAFSRASDGRLYVSSRSTIGENPVSNPHVWFLWSAFFGIPGEVKAFHGTADQLALHISAGWHECFGSPITWLANFDGIGYITVPEFTANTGDYITLNSIWDGSTSTFSTILDADEVDNIYLAIGTDGKWHFDPTVVTLEVDGRTVATGISSAKVNVRQRIRLDVIGTVSTGYAITTIGKAIDTNLPSPAGLFTGHLWMIKFQTNGSYISNARSYDNIHEQTSSPSATVFTNTITNSNHGTFQNMSPLWISANPRGDDIPDLRGKYMRGATTSGGTGGTDFIQAAGTVVASLTPSGGHRHGTHTASHTLTVAEMPSHRHTMNHQHASTTTGSADYSIDTMNTGTSHRHGGGMGSHDGASSHRHGNYKTYSSNARGAYSADYDNADWNTSTSGSHTHNTLSMSITDNTGSTGSTHSHTHPSTNSLWEGSHTHNITVSFNGTFFDNRPQSTEVVYLKFI